MTFLMMNPQYHCCPKTLDPFHRPLYGPRNYLRSDLEQPKPIIDTTPSFKFENTQKDLIGDLFTETQEQIRKMQELQATNQQSSVLQF